MKRQQGEKVAKHTFVVSTNCWSGLQCTQLLLFNSLRRRSRTRGDAHRVVRPDTQPEQQSASSCFKNVFQTVPCSCATGMAQLPRDTLLLLLLLGRVELQPLKHA